MQALIEAIIKAEKLQDPFYICVKPSVFDGKKIAIRVCYN